MHPDMEEDLQMIKPLVQAVEMLLEKVESLENRVQSVEKSLYEELLGGIDSLYKKNVREESIGGLKAKYSADFEPHAETFGELYPGTDLYERLHDLMEEAKGQDGYSDDDFDGKVKGMFEEMGAKFGKLRGIPQKTEGEASEEPKVEAEITTIEAKPDDIDKRIMERMKKDPTMRGR